MASASPLKYLAGYPENLRVQVQQLLDQGRLGEVLLAKYPQGHGVRTDKALYDYVMELKNDFLRSSEPLSKVAFDSKLHVIAHALGTHTTVSRVQGNKLKAKREIRVATLFKDVPAEFLRMPLWPSRSTMMVAAILRRVPSSSYWSMTTVEV